MVCGPDVLPKRLDYFSSVFSEQMFPFFHAWPWPPNAQTFLCPRELKALLLCVGSGESEQEHKSPALRTAWRRAPGLWGAAALFVPLRAVSRCLRVANWRFFLWPLTPVPQTIPLLRADHRLPKTLVSSIAQMQPSSLFRPELCLLSLDNIA